MIKAPGDFPRGLFFVFFLRAVRTSGGGPSGGGQTSTIDWKVCLRCGEVNPGGGQTSTIDWGVCLRCGEVR